VGIIRAGGVLRFNDPRAAKLKPGDRVIYLQSHRG